MDLKQMLTSIVPFIQTVGIRIDSIEPGRAVATLPARDEVNNHLGTAHAGAAYTVGESASGGAVLSVVADLLPTVYVALKSATVTHLKARAGDVVATAQVDGEPKAIRQTFDATGKVDFNVPVSLAVDGVEVATVVYTWAVRAPRS